MTVTDGQAYGLVDRPGRAEEHLLEVTFLDSGMRVYSFAFA